MSLPGDTRAQGDFEQYFTVFHGSSPEDVSHARRLWSALSLLPPLESRLVSADVHQRLPVSRPQRGSAPAAPAASAQQQQQQQPEALNVAALRQREEERRRYEAMGDRRMEILALLRRQRERRIQKELVSVAFKPKGKPNGEPATKPHHLSDTDPDRELVKQLQ